MWLKDHMREQVLDLERMASELLETAGRLPPGAERDDVLLEIDRLRGRVAAFSRAASVGVM
jgi:hypothetical protein